ncbi:MAG: DUF5399 family protein [Waddliaceae bacterium]|jgi:hypothetical protein|nr:DUF5399 family protein [Waddliaceae bacterium]MBT3579580.1 DUF5399 family protein [Waddliaceae bacterium]MBT4444442.1 DUF5399 family protein [Waddliaceae bacterium]MBT6928187.1 DUF5399 family protein [Waddliaceae bacterium]MBT7264332.1 DUF5399 family protein [Waddliaceae bacterium]
MENIYKLPFQVHIEYAQRTRLIESVNEQYRISEAGSIPSQMSVVNTFPRTLELDMLFGMMTSNAPWAMFMPPRKFYSQRRPSFISYRAAPSLGTLEKQAADYLKLKNLSSLSDEEGEEGEGREEEEEEKSALCSCFEQLDEINSWKGHILGRVAELLAG